MHICVRVTCMYVCMYVRVYVHMNMCVYICMYVCIYVHMNMCRPQSNMLKNWPKILLEISQKFPLLCLDFFLLCSIMLTVIIAVRYLYTHNLYNN